MFLTFTHKGAGSNPNPCADILNPQTRHFIGSFFSQLRCNFYRKIYPSMLFVLEKHSFFFPLHICCIYTSKNFQFFFHTFRCLLMLALKTLLNDPSSWSCYSCFCAYACRAATSLACVVLTQKSE